MKYSSFSRKNKKGSKNTGRYPHAQAETQKENPENKSGLERTDDNAVMDDSGQNTDTAENPSASLNPFAPDGPPRPADAAPPKKPDLSADTAKDRSSNLPLQAPQSSAPSQQTDRVQPADRGIAENAAELDSSADNSTAAQTKLSNASGLPRQDEAESEQSDESDMVDMAPGRSERPKRKKSKAISAKENLIFLTACIAVIVAILVVSIKDSSNTADVSPEITPPAGQSTLTPPGAWANPTPTGPPLISEPSGMIIMDNSVNAKQILVEEKRINRPAVYGSELLFSAGNGSIEKPVLTTLYLFDVTTQKYTKIATTQIEDGEIFEYFLSDKWIIWLDTDHKGTNIIYKMNRQTNEISKVREVGNLRPKLSLYGDLLAWMEQVSEESDRLYLLELNSEEDIVIEEFHETAYALSAPYIYENTVIWVGADPSGSGDSAIFRADFTMDDNYNPEEQEQGGEQTSAISAAPSTSAAGQTAAQSTSAAETASPTASPTASASASATVPEGPWLPLPSSAENETLKVYYYPAGMYVHEPMYNGQVVVWIDKNKAPDSSLYMLDLTSGEVSLLQTGVTSYALGTDFVVINSNQEIWAYYYRANTLIRVSSADRASILPETQGRVVVWEDKSSSSSGDVFMYNILG